jgi:hypothetical protein
MKQLYSQASPTHGRTSKACGFAWQKIPAIGFLLLAAMMIAGCQSEQGTTSGTSQQLVPLVPYSKGPDSPPQVKGPTSPPPQSDASPQAITEKETVKYSLPSSPTVEILN